MNTVELTDREREALTHKANGLTCAQIAPLMSIKPNTVHNLLVKIYLKLGARNDVQACVLALVTRQIRVQDIELPAKLRAAT